MYCLCRQVNYWIQFVENHWMPGASSPYVFVIGSHIDALHKAQESAFKITNIEEHVRSRLKMSPLVLNGYFSIDCR